MAIAFKIVHRGDGWHVLSEDGQKNVGGSYKTEAEAVERLRQVEGHKAHAASTASSALHTPSLIGESKAMARAFSVEAPLRLSAEPADCWDQVAKFGQFVKNDGDGPQIATFNLQHLGEFMSNFARQVNPLWADTNHDFGEANAKYDALALVVDGKPIRVVTRGAPEQKPIAAPPPEQLVNPDSGRVEDGLYAHRYEVTPQGQDKRRSTTRRCRATDASLTRLSRTMMQLFALPGSSRSRSCRSWRSFPYQSGRAHSLAGASMVCESTGSASLALLGWTRLSGSPVHRSPGTCSGVTTV